MIDLLEIRDFLDPETCARICAEMGAAVGEPASLLGVGEARSVQPLVRKAAQVAPQAWAREQVMRRLELSASALEARFDAVLGPCEEPQFLRYEAGDFFVAHQDGNTPLIHDQSRFRRVSVTIFLNAQSENPASGAYGGGELVFHGPYAGPPERRPIAPPPGTLVAFRAETTHEVVPVTHGQRFSIVTWLPAAV
jgi:SM-20-related protein